MSLRRRVLLGFLLVAMVLVGTGAAVASAFERDLLARTDQELLDVANRPALQPGGPGGPGRGGRALAGVRPATEPLSDLYLAVALADGTGLTRVGRPLDQDQRPPALAPEQLVGQPGTPFRAESADGTGSWRVVVLDDRLRRGLLVVATELDGVQATQRRLWLIQVAGAGAVLVALGAISWWVLRLGVRPLVAMATTADGIAAGGVAAGELSRRVDQEDTRTEAGRLGAAFNAMLDAIEQAFRDRQASEDRLRRFVADASHELRTPLTSMRGYAELWQAGGLRAPGELDQAMHRLAEEGRRMGGLVDDLLLLARLDQQRPLERRPVYLDALAADAVADALVVDPERPLTLVSAPVAVEGDEARLRQVLANLLTNARVHTPAGTPVHVDVSAAGSTSRLVVADEGPGMAPAVLAHAFERFYRGDDARARSTGGSGLGLSIVDAVARAHGGRASATSTPGRGSRFVVELPLAGATPPAQGAPHPAVPA